MAEPAIVALIGLATAFTGWVGYAVRNAVVRRRAEKRLDDGLGAFREGEEATVVGTVRALGPPLIAPLTGKECVAYDTRVRYGIINFSSRPELVVVKLIPFEIEAASGAVRVEAEHAELLFRREPLIPRNLEREAEFLQQHRVTGSLADIDTSEVCVEVGSRVAVHGVVALEVAVPRGDVGYREGGTRISLGPHPEHQLTIGEPR